MGVKDIEVEWIDFGTKYIADLVRAIEEGFAVAFHAKRLEEFDVE